MGHNSHGLLYLAGVNDPNAAATHKSVLNGQNRHLSVIDGSLQFRGTADRLLRALPSVGPVKMT